MKTNYEVYIKFNSTHTATIKSMSDLLNHPLFYNTSVKEIEVVGFIDNGLDDYYNHKLQSWKQNIYRLVENHRLVVNNPELYTNYINH